MKNFCIKLCCLCCVKSIRVSVIPDAEDSLIPRVNQSIGDNGNDQRIIIEERKETERTVIDTAFFIEPCIKEEWLRDEERDLIPMTRRQMMDVFNSEFNITEGYELLHDKDNMKLSIRQDSRVISGFPMIRMDYFLPKSDFPSGTTLEDLSSYMSWPEKRKKWDTQMKDYLLLEGTNTNGMVYLWMNKPTIIIAERDMIEKLISFRGDDNCYYSFSSSLNDEACPIKDNVVRVVDWYTSYSISEDEEYFYFKTLNQVDFKMPMPSFIVKMTLPGKLKEWYRVLKAVMHSDKEPKREPKEQNEDNTVKEDEEKQNDIIS